MIRRQGEPNSFWGTATQSGVVSARGIVDTYVVAYTKEATGVNQLSRAARLGQAVDQLCVFMSVDNPTTITVYVAQGNQPTVEGVDMDVEDQPSTFYPLYWQTTQMKYTFSTAGQAAFIIPDFAPGWIALESSANVNALCGYESCAS